MRKVKRLTIICLILAIFAGCSGTNSSESTTEENKQPESISSDNVSSDYKIHNTELQVFVAASLNNAMEEIVSAYTEEHPEVRIVLNADSSGTLTTQIQEGYECDVFFSASKDKMDILEKGGFLVDGTCVDVVNNQVCLVTYKGSDTRVSGLSDICRASSIALADASVPVGKYTRKALMAAGIIDKTEDVSEYTTAKLQEVLGVTDISEQSNVSKVITAVAEHSCEIGTAYYSDIYGHGDDIEIIEKIDYSLTGDVIYPVAQVVNAKADEKRISAASDFIRFITSDDAKSIFEKYLFDTSETWKN